MKTFQTYKTCIFAFLIATSVVILTFNQAYSLSGHAVHVIELDDDTINPVTAEYISESIDRAYNEKAECLIIKLDTPGGLLNSTRLIVKKMLTAKVPVVVYIAPSGSRAGSAGVFITYASHVAAMAPSTNIGAAHPVQMGGQRPKKTEDWQELKELLQDLKQDREKQPDKEESETKKKTAEDKEEKKEQKDNEILPDENPMESKILQDTVAFIRAIAKERNRNEEWAVESVVKSSSITAEDALERGVVEIIAKDIDDLLLQLNGRTVAVNETEKVLNTKDAQIIEVPMDSTQKLFNVLADPNIAYFLMILGFYGLLYEITHPGFGVPGVLGLLFLILAFYSMQTLPTNYAGLALIIMGICLLIAEAYTPTFGLLTLGGLVCMVLGSMLLFESIDPIMRVSKSAIFSVSAATTIITLVLVRSAIHSFRAKVVSGKEGLVGEHGEVQVAIKKEKKGKVFVHGELWNAVADEDIERNEEVEVLSIDGLMIRVQKRTSAEKN